MAMDGAARHILLCTRHRLKIHLKIAIALALTIGGGAATARASSTAAVQGLYEYCPLASGAERCVGRLTDIAAGSFAVVLNYAVFQADSVQLRRYMDVATRLGLKLIWPMKDGPWWGVGSLGSAFPRLARSCGCTGNAALVRYIVGLTARSRATWGYYLADEQAPLFAPLVAAFSQRLRALDPRHPRLAIAGGEDSVADLLSPFAASADVIGADTYPVGTGQPLDRVGFVGQKVRAVAHAAHRKTAIALQAFDWSSYPDAGRWDAPRWPTRTEMRAMRDLAIRAVDPSLVLWYSYFDIRRAPDSDRRWHDLVWAAYGTVPRAHTVAASDRTPS